MNKKTKLIVNPVAGNNNAYKNWPDVNRLIQNSLGELSAEFTTGPLDATRIARQALLAGYENIVAMGGDGTLNEIVNGFFNGGKLINPEANLGVIPMGTGADWMKTVDITDDIEQAVARIEQNSPHKCDLGLITLDSEGEPFSRYFLNIGDAGFGGALVGIVNQSTKALGAFFAYLIGLLKTLAVYQNKPVQIKIDDSFEKEMRINSVTVANGQYFGGGMWIAPKAKIDDGLFEIIIVGDINRREALANIHRLYNGTLANHPKVTYLQGKRVSLNSEMDVLIEADGEQVGKLPATFEIIPAALNFIY